MALAKALECGGSDAALTWEAAIADGLPARQRCNPLIHPHAFTLIEVLVTIALIILVVGILVPSLGSARQQARMAVCGSNIRQLGVANHGYAAENHDYFVPAASDEYLGFGGRRRWHGMRKGLGVSDQADQNLFDSRFSPLARYIEGAPALPLSALNSSTPLAGRCELKECPSFIAGRDFTRDGASNAFEAGAGAYGYNHIYIGGRYDLFNGGPRAVMLGAQTTDVRQPSLTVMFAEAAYAQRLVGGAIVMIESSFTYPPFIIAGTAPANAQEMAGPSIHFRHLGRALVTWTDGHGDSQRMSFSGNYPSGITTSRIRNLGLGWFGPRGNDWFDLK